MVDLSNRRVFISGPMTGIKHYNVEAFARAHALCKEMGAESVYNPALSWLLTPAGQARHLGHADWMRTCLTELVGGGDERYDLLVQLPGWDGSEGALTEFDVACACGIECVELTRLTGDADA